MVNPYKKCPKCGEKNLRNAMRCKNCKEWFLLEEPNDLVCSAKKEKSFKVTEIDEDLLNYLLKVFFVIVIAGIFFLYIILKPHPVTAYIKIENAKLCHKANPNSCYKEIKLLEPIEVYQSAYKSNGYLKTESGDFIKETSITYKDTKEYNYLKYKKEKEEKRIEEEKNFQTKIKLSENEKEAINDELVKLQNEINGIFDYHETVKDVFNYYYIDPIVWNSFNYMEKRELLLKCRVISTLTAILKAENYDKSQASGYYLLYSVGTSINNYQNGELLAGLRNGELIIK